MTTSEQQRNGPRRPPAGAGATSRGILPAAPRDAATAQPQLAVTLHGLGPGLIGISLNTGGTPDPEAGRVALAVIRGPLPARLEPVPWIPAGPAAQRPGDSALPALTEREGRVLSLVAAGGTNASIARRLGCSPRTVAKHLERIYAKLAVSGRAAAAARFAEGWKEPSLPAPPSVAIGAAGAPPGNILSSSTATGPDRQQNGTKETSVNDDLKQVWVASATLESLQGEVDRAETDLDSFIEGALAAGESVDGISDAANLTAAEVRLRMKDLGIERSSGAAGDSDDGGS